MSIYPGALDNLDDDHADEPARLVGPDLDEARAAINAVQGTLGVNPQGAEATVAARVASLAEAVEVVESRAVPQTALGAAYTLDMASGKNIFLVGASVNQSRALLTAHCTLTITNAVGAAVARLFVKEDPTGGWSLTIVHGSDTIPVTDLNAAINGITTIDVTFLSATDFEVQVVGTAAGNASAAAPVNTVAPDVTGTSNTGQTLTCSTGTWTGTATITYARQWKNAGVAISGETGTTYVVQAGDVGDALKCTVTATNAAGSVAADSNTVTGLAAPTAPGQVTGLGATAGAGQVALAWTAPASDGGSAITDYLVEFRTGAAAFAPFAHAASTTPAITVTGLTNGTAYDFRVSAVNAVGTGTASSTATATPAGGVWAGASARIWVKPETLPATDETSLVAGGWPDSSGLGNHGVAAGLPAPIVKNAIVNGHPVVRFGGGTNTITFPSLAARTQGLGLVVVKVTNDPGASQNGLWLFGPNGQKTAFPFSDGVIYDDFGSTVRKTTVSPTPSLSSGFHIYEVWSAAGAWTSWLDGAQLFTTATNTVGFPDAPILGFSSMTFIGDVPEFVFLDDLTNQVACRAYLKAKYATP